MKNELPKKNETVGVNCFKLYMLILKGLISWPMGTAEIKV